MFSRIVPLNSQASWSTMPKAVRGALRFLAGGNDLGIYRVGIRGSMRTKSLEVALWTEGGNFPRSPRARCSTP